VDIDLAASLTEAAPVMTWVLTPIAAVAGIVLVKKLVPFGLKLFKRA